MSSKLTYTNHALDMLTKRSISTAEVDECIRNPKRRSVFMSGETKILGHNMVCIVLSKGLDRVITVYRNNPQRSYDIKRKLRKKGKIQ